MGQGSSVAVSCSVAWDLPYASGMALKSKTNKQNKTKKQKLMIHSASQDSDLIGQGCDLESELLFFICFFSFGFCPFRAQPLAYGGSQARGPIAAAAAGLHHSHSNIRF